MNILEEYTECLNKLNKIDEFRKTLDEQMSLIDLKQSDLLHYAENKEKLNFLQAYNLYKELKKVRKERRLVKNNMEISNLIESNLEKLKNRQARKNLINILNNKYEQINKEYNYREYSEDNLKEIIGGK